MAVIRNPGSVLPDRDSPVHEGMSEQAAGEAIANYIERASAALGADSEDIELFDGDRTFNVPVEESSGESSGEAKTDDETPRDSELGAAPDDSPEDTETEETVATEEAASEEDDADVIDLEASQLAQLLGVEEDALIVDDEGAIQLRYQVGNERGATNLKDMIASYQLQGHVNQKSQQLSEERRMLQEQVEAQRGQLVAAIQSAEHFRQAVEEAVLERYSRVDWDKLKEDDPGRWSALQVEMNSEVNALRHRAQQVAEKAQEAYQAQQQQQQQEMQRLVAAEQEQLFKHLPDLADEAKRPGILQGFNEYLLGYGFRPEEIQGVRDHRFMRVIADAVAYRREAAKTPAEKANIPVKKRLARVPRVAKGSVPQNEVNRRQDRKTAAGKRLRISGSDDDAARFAVESGIADAVLGE